MGWFSKNDQLSGFTSSSTAEEVTQGIDGSGLTAIVTGASSGIGAEAARVLAMRGVHVIMAIRNAGTGEEVKASIVKEIPRAKIDVMKLDLSSFDSVKNFASNYNSTGLPLNILINNAGVASYSTFLESKDNIEIMFATNHLGHFLLTNCLLDNMKRTAEKTGKEGRIVNVSSYGHYFTYKGGIGFDVLNDRSKFNGYRAYGQSKLANLLHANELAKRLKEEGTNVTANSLSPGTVATNLFRNTGILRGPLNLIGKLMFKTVHQGAATTCYLALHPEVKGVTGEYFSDCKVDKPTDEGRDPVLAKKLWDVSLSMTN